MGAALNAALPLLRLLNGSPEGLSVQTLSAQLGEDSAAVLATAQELTALDPSLLHQESGSAEESLLLRLNRSLDFLDSSFLSSRCPGPGRVTVLECISSTNSYLLERLGELQKGDCVLTEIQYSGRGRRNRVWRSGVCCDLLLSLGWVFESWQSIWGLPLVAGSTALNTLQALGVADLSLKWPNDLYFLGRKLGGILVETVPGPDGTVKTVIGMGINLGPCYDTNLKSDSATLAGKGVPCGRNMLCAAVINALRSGCELFAAQGLEPFLTALRNNDFLYGHRVVVEVEDLVYEGVARGIDGQGALLLETVSGTLPLSSGHISQVL
ncbi:MAG: biotin--[Succinivibrio sp.]|nr:biotin--[acetyl-CoA-carboxylase] ligase [Succinivibrio sp.]